MSFWGMGEVTMEAQYTTNEMQLTEVALLQHRQAICGAILGKGISDRESSIYIPRCNLHTAIGRCM